MVTHFNWITPCNLNCQFTMVPKLECLIRTPSCFVLNIANIVTSDYKLSGKKSHDYHACPPTIHFTIAICVRCPMKSKKVFTCLLSFLRWMCGINIVTEEISYWRVKIVQIMCLFEICMPTHLFDLMPNMLVHLPKKVELAGSVHNIWLCFLERYIKLWNQWFVKNIIPRVAWVRDTWPKSHCFILENVHEVDSNRKTNQEWRHDTKGKQSDFAQNTQQKKVGLRHSQHVNKQSWQLC